MTIALALLGAAGASACRPPAPIVVVDTTHSQVGQPEGKTGVNYVVPPTPRVTLDARQFDFSKSLYPDVRPNAVQVVLGEKREYTAKWAPSGVVQLSKDTLEPLNSSPPFAGFQSGDQAVVAIGEERVDAEKKELVLKLLWAALIDVKP